MNKLEFGVQEDEDKILKILVPEDLDYTDAFKEEFDKYLEASCPDYFKDTDKKEIEYEIELLRSRIDSIPIEKILDRMGFPVNYIDLINLANLRNESLLYI